MITRDFIEQDLQLQRFAATPQAKKPRFNWSDLASPVESLPEFSEFDIDSATEQILKESVSSLLITYASCAYEA